MPSDDALVEGLGETIDQTAAEILGILGQHNMPTPVVAAAVPVEPDDEEVEEVSSTAKQAAAAGIIAMLLSMGASEEIAVAILGQIPRPGSLENAAVRERLRNLHEVVNATVADNYNRYLAEGVSEADALRRALKDAANSARIQAEAEALHAVNVGIDGLGDHFTGQGFGVTKTWRTRLDNRVRDTHRAAEGQQVPYNSTYRVGGYPMRFPGDISAPPALWVNCRCISVLSAEIEFAAPPSEN